MAALEKASQNGNLKLGRNGGSLIHTLSRINWHTYIQAPFAGAEHVFRYLGAYTHRVGIANSRLRDVHDDGITFATRGEHTVTLQPLEFTRRFLLHVLPKGFVKIRHYGLLASAAKTKHAQAVEALGPAPITRRIPITNAVGEAEETDIVSPSPVTESDPPTLLCAALSLFVCPACRTGVLMFLTEGPDPPR